MTGGGLSVDLQGQRDVFKRLDNFSDVRIDISQSRAGPFSVGRVLVTKAGNHSYAVAGQYPLALTVTDNAGASASAATSVTVK